MSLLFINGFITLRWLDILDILLVAFLIYELYNLIKGTVAINIFIGIIAIYFVWKLVEAFEMDLLSQILGQFISVGVIALIIVFQQEVRQFLLLLGTPNFIQKGPKRFLFWRWQINKPDLLDIEPIVAACKSMTETKTGALIVITRSNELKQYIETGEVIDARISKQLLENIFYKNSPLHDGAVIISLNTIKAARCILPVSESTDIPPHMGLRHRAAAGITEESDCIALIVSEQRGAISFSTGGKIAENISPLRLQEILEKEFKAL
jgi:diadenylate cyclase